MMQESVVNMDVRYTFLVPKVVMVVLLVVDFMLGFAKVLEWRLLVSASTTT